jgi:hypothetical protein
MDNSNEIEILTPPFMSRPIYSNITNMFYDGKFTCEDQLFLMKMLKETSFLTTNLRRSNGCKVGSSQVGEIIEC